MKLRGLVKLLAYGQLCLSLFFVSTSVSAQALKQTPITAKINATIGGYYECLPSDYVSNPTKKYPLLVFLHGIGECGDGSQAQLPRVLTNGPPKLINNGSFPSSFNVNGQSYSFIVISPQYSGNDRTTATLDALMTYIMAKYRVDPGRVYLTGLSMGGGISWIYGGTKEVAKNLAALVVVSGNTSAYDVLVNVVGAANTPVWAFHNQNDPTVPSQYTIDWITKLNAYKPAMNPAAKKTIFPVSGHDAWDQAYDPNYRESGKNVYEFMLSYTRSSAAAPAPAAPPVANAGADKSLTLPVNTITLSGTGTTTSGTMSSYGWSRVSGPTQYTMLNGTTANLSLSNLVAGSYTFRLTVKNSAGLTATDDVNVIVNSPSVPTIPVGNDSVVIQAENYSGMSGVATQGTTDIGGGNNVGWIDTNDWMNYSANVATAGTYLLSFRIAAPSQGSRIQVKKSDGTVLTALNLPVTGGYQTWTTVSVPVNLTAGVQTLQLFALTGGWNLNWLSLMKITGSAPSTPLSPKTVQVSIYGGANPYSNTQWNNWNIGTGGVVNRVSSKFLYSDGTASAISAVLSQSTGIGDNGTGGQSGMAPVEVLRYSSYSTVTRTVTINGLSTSKKYSLAVYASRNNNSGNSTIFAINGVNVTVASYNNLAQAATFNNLTPDAQGQIVLTITKVNTYNYINGFTLTEAATGTASTSADDGVQSAMASMPAFAEPAGNVFSYYPNPLRDALVLQINNDKTGPMRIQIIGINGAILKDYSFRKEQSFFTQTLYLGQLPTGVYLMKVQIGNDVQVRKLVKQ